MKRVGAEDKPLISLARTWCESNAPLHTAARCEHDRHALLASLAATTDDLAAELERKGLSRADAEWLLWRFTRWLIDDLHDIDLLRKELARCIREEEPI